MAALTHLSIITPGAVKFEGSAEIVVAPGAAGDLGALANHAPLLTTLRTGVVRATVADGATRRIEYAIDGGLMQVLPDKVIILTDLALERGEVDLEEARRDLKQSEEALAHKRGGDDKPERQAVAWAQARLDVAQRPGV